MRAPEAAEAARPEATATGFFCRGARATTDEAGARARKAAVVAAAAATVAREAKLRPLVGLRLVPVAW
jgi:hypothetical protein